MKQQQILIFAGAGASVDSNLPTFRVESNGSNTESASTVWGTEHVDKVCNFLKWRRVNYKPVNVDDVLRIHNFYKTVQAEVRAADPNDFHRYVAELCNDARFDVSIVTTNVDDLFERAGVPHDRVVHLHGSILRRRCTACRYKYEDTTTTWVSVADFERCPRTKCRSRMVKTDVAFYGETCPAYSLGVQAFNRLRAGDTLMMVGASGETFRDAERLWIKCQRRGVHTIHINPSAGPHQKYPADFGIMQKIKHALADLDFHLRLRHRIEDAICEA